MGCSTTPTQEPEFPKTLIGMKKETIRELKDECLKDIFYGKPTDYPLTNYRTYRILVLRMGYIGPSPESWCREYARKRVL